MNYRRYARQLALPDFGVEGQQKLLNSCVALVGMGGLGCPAAQSLAAAGVGKLILIDGDTVQLHNLHRQLLFTTSDCGKPKVDVAKERLLAVNPEIELVAIAEFLSEENVFQVLESVNVVIDASDRLEIRYLLDKWSEKSKKPWIHAGLFRHESLISVLNPAGKGPFYADIFPEMPENDAVPPCEVAGVLPMVPAIVGNIQAQEAIRIVLGEKGGLQGKMLVTNWWTMEWRIIEL